MLDDVICISKIITLEVEFCLLQSGMNHLIHDSLLSGSLLLTIYFGVLCITSDCLFIDTACATEIFQKKLQ